MFCSIFLVLCHKGVSVWCFVFFFLALCLRPALLGLLQAFHRHIPTLIRALGKSYSELLHIISNPPQGSENLLTLVTSILIIEDWLYHSINFWLLYYEWMLSVEFVLLKVLQILTQETTPSSDLIATVKCLYETKLRVCPITKSIPEFSTDGWIFTYLLNWTGSLLQDVTILVPLLASLSKNEVNLMSFFLFSFCVYIIVLLFCLCLILHGPIILTQNIIEKKKIFLNPMFKIHLPECNCSSILM